MKLMLTKAVKAMVRGTSTETRNVMCKRTVTLTEIIVVCGTICCLAATMRAFAVSESGMETAEIGREYALVKRAEIESVKARQRYPWNGKVDVDFTLIGSEGAQYCAVFSVEDVVGGTNLPALTVTVSPNAIVPDGKDVNPAGESIAPGVHRWVWNADADLPDGFECERVSVKIKALGDGAFTYSVRFDANGGEGTMSDDMFIYGVEKVLLANTFTRTGYTFQGWSTSASGAKVYDDKQSVSNLTETSGSIVNLYAVWSPITYMVRFNANGGTGTMVNESFTYGTAKTLTANTFTRTGYTFQGWSTSASGAKVYSDKQSVSNLTKVSGAMVNLYAVWAPALYMVIDLSTGSTASSYPVNYLASVPSGGWNDTHRGNYLVLRKIEKGSNSVAGAMSSDMWVGVFEVTQLQYKNVKGNNPSSHTGDYRPVEHAGYFACSDFLTRLSNRTGLTFRMPTRNEWRYACRAGSTVSTFSANTATARYSSTANDGKGGYNTYHTKVGSYKANGWGLYDMLGNVGEWTSTDLSGDSSYYTAYLLGGSATLSGTPNDATIFLGGTSWGGDDVEGFRVFGLVQ